MFSKIKTFFKNLDDKILKEDETKLPNQNFKGQRIQKKVVGQGPNPTREQYESAFRLDPEIRMQSRKLRMTNWGYLMGFMAWYTGVVLFITYRLRSDDLDTLEKEAEERIKIQRQAKLLRQNNQKNDQQ